MKAFPLIPTSPKTTLFPVTCSFSLDDLRKTLPGVEALAGLVGEELREAVTRLLGTLAEDADVALDGEMVTVTSRRVGPATMAARRFLERAAELTPEDPLVYSSLAALHFEAKEDGITCQPHYNIVCFVHESNRVAFPRRSGR